MNFPALPGGAAPAEACPVDTHPNPQGFLMLGVCYPEDCCVVNEQQGFGVMHSCPHPPGPWSGEQVALRQHDKDRLTATVNVF